MEVQEEVLEELPNYVKDHRTEALGILDVAQWHALLQKVPMKQVQVIADWLLEHPQAVSPN